MTRQPEPIALAELAVVTGGALPRVPRCFWPFCGELPLPTPTFPSPDFPSPTFPRPPWKPTV